MGCETALLRENASMVNSLEEVSRHGEGLLVADARETFCASGVVHIASSRGIGGVRVGGNLAGIQAVVRQGTRERRMESVDRIGLMRGVQRFHPMASTREWRGLRGGRSKGGLVWRFWAADTVDPAPFSG